jgi:hypothetical protein
MSSMRSKSVVDRRHKRAVFGVIAVMLALAAILPLTLRFVAYQVLLGYAAVLLASAFLLWLLYGTFYELRDTCIICRSGPFVEKIGYDTIRYIGHCEGMRIEIRRIDIRPIGLGKQRGIGLITGTTMISPENREIFLVYLKKCCRYLDKAG